MAEDFDDYMDEHYDEDEPLDLDFEFTEEEIAEIRRAEQDANMGFTYEHTYIDGKSCLKCNKCKRTAEIYDRPFPHRFDCPMKR